MGILTARGKALVALGATCAIAGWALGWPAGLALGALLLLVPILGAISVRRSRFVLGSSRVVSPTQFPVGTEAEVVLTVENGSRLASGVLLLQDKVPEALSESTRVLLDRVPPNAQRSERYQIVGRQRGRARIGPLAVTVTDPFGTAILTRHFTETNPVLVTPLIVALDKAGASLSPGGRGETLFRSLAARGDDDVLPREHRAGDDMRRIHWRATARYGDLMVRREEQAWHSSMVVILDNRASAHQGSGVASTFEWAVSAAASVAMHYVQLGWRVTVVTASGAVLGDTQSSGGGDAESLLHAFSDVRLGAEAMAHTLSIDLEGVSAVVAVLGRVTDDTARALVRPASGFAGCLPLDPSPTDHLRAQGWKVSPWTRGTSVSEAWARISPARTGAAQ
jgi:uncharacterized protein (DUF58 family)